MSESECEGANVGEKEFEKLYITLDERVEWGVIVARGGRAKVNEEGTKQRKLNVQNRLISKSKCSLVYKKCLVLKREMGMTKKKVHEKWIANSKKHVKKKKTTTTITRKITRRKKSGRIRDAAIVEGRECGDNDELETSGELFWDLVLAYRVRSWTHRALLYTIGHCCYKVILTEETL